MPSPAAKVPLVMVDEYPDIGNVTALKLGKPRLADVYTLLPLATTMSTIPFVTNHVSVFTDTLVMIPPKGMI
jgi:hypothetical protein